MKKICEICGKEYEAKRDTSRYCSAKCRVRAGRVSVTKDAVSVTSKPVSVTRDALGVTVRVSVTGRDDIWSEQYDTSEEGFRRRNKAWDTFQPQFRRDTITACKRINADHVAIRAAAMAQRDNEAVSAVRGLVEV